MKTKIKVPVTAQVFAIVEIEVDVERSPLGEALVKKADLDRAKELALDVEFPEKDAVIIDGSVQVDNEGFDSQTKKELKRTARIEEDFAQSIEPRVTVLKTEKVEPKSVLKVA